MNVTAGFITLAIVTTIALNVTWPVVDAVIYGDKATATGALTFSDNVTDGELVNISNYTFEFDDDNSYTAGHIQVNVTNQTDGSIDLSIAAANMTNAINNNASVAALVQAVAT